MNATNDFHLDLYRTDEQRMPTRGILVMVCDYKTFTVYICKSLCGCVSCFVGRKLDTELSRYLEDVKPEGKDYIPPIKSCKAIIAP